MARSIEHIAVVTTNYPSPAHPAHGTFVAQLVTAVARRGVRCDVIHPLPLQEAAAERAALERVGPRDYGTLPLTVARPKYISFSNKRFGPINTFVATQFAFQRAAHAAVRGLSGTPDAIYGHFMYSSGAAAIKIGRRLNIPSFVAVGEGKFWGAQAAGMDRARRDFRDVTGVVAVSSEIRNNLIADIGVAEEKIAVFPNGTNIEIFHPRDMLEMRRKHGLPEDKFIAVFLGHFNENKGARRVAQAAEGLDALGVVYLGRGALEPEGSHILRKGLVPHADVPEILCAADVFVLPTKHEGSCNAIVEAIASGLPIISSHGEFNDNLLDETMSIRVDPTNVDEIRAALVRLRDDKQLRSEMAAAAAERGKLLDINRRAENICSWIAEKIEGYETST